jgi:ketosteroid isomerase-like protein
MSRENVEVVRQPIAVSTSTRRRLLERLFLRFPGLGPVVTRPVFRLRASSRLRRAMIRYGVRLAVEAANRKDHEAAFVLAPPDFESTLQPEWVGIGFDPVYRGREGRVRLQRQFEAELGEFENDPEEIIDLGDHLLLLGRMRGTGRGSGAAFDSEVVYVLTLSRGRVVRERLFRSHEEALEAAGLSE